MVSFSQEFKSFLDEVCFSFEERSNGLYCVLVPESAIRPFPLILFFSRDQDKVVFENALSFTVGRKPEQVSRVFSSSFKSVMEGVNVRVRFRENVMDINVSGLRELDIDVFEGLIRGYAGGFTEILFSFRDYSLAEYKRLGLSMGDFRIILVLATLDELGEALYFESRVMAEDFLTRPNDDGVYVTRAIGKDYLGFPVLSIVSEKMDSYVVYVPSEEGGELIPVDVRKELLFIRDYLPLRFVEKRSDLASVLSELIDKPYLILKYLGTLKEIVNELEKRKIKRSLEILLREQPRDMMGFVSFVRFPSDEDIDKALRKLKRLIEKLESVSLMEKNLRKLLIYRIIAEKMKDVDSLITGKIIAEKIRKLHKFGGGRALYLSQDELKEILGDRDKVRVRIIEDSSGKKRIIIEPLDEERE